MKTTLRFAITVESNVPDGYDLRDSIAGAIIGLKQTWISDTDDVSEIRFQIVEVDMPEAGLYQFTPSGQFPSA